MYQTTQSYCIGSMCSGSVAYSSSSYGSGLESIANGYVSNAPMDVGGMSYSVSAPTASGSYMMSCGDPVEYITSGVSMPMYLDVGGNGNSYGGCHSNCGFTNYSVISLSNSNGGRGGRSSLPTYELFKTRENYHFIPDNFIVPGRSGFFVGEAEEVRSFVEEAFEIMFGEKFPRDVKVSVLNKEKFDKIANNPGAVGLSINRKKFGMLSEIFILNDNLARVMLTIGHELGHVLTETLPSAHDEEAKAYAFSLAWMKIIKENDIAGLGNALVTENPANNGLHDVAFNYVVKKLKEGVKAWKLYLELIKGRVAVGS